MDRLSHAREILSKKILEDFKGKITGSNCDCVVGENPENQFFVGKLLCNGDDESRASSEVFVESLGLDFYIDESQISQAEIRIFPKGDLYYRAYPTLEQQRQTILVQANSIKEKQYIDFEDLYSDYLEEKEDLNKVKCKLVPVYKKVRIDSENCVVSFKPKEILNDELTYGNITSDHNENLKIREHINYLAEQIELDNDYYSNRIHEETKLEDLFNHESYKNFINRTKNTNAPNNQNWDIYIDISVKKIKTKYLISVALVNNSLVQSNSDSKKSFKKATDKQTIETLFNSAIEVQLKNADFEPIELDYFQNDYKYDKRQFAIGLNCSVDYISTNNSLITNNLPVFEQKRLVTRDDLSVKFQALIDEPINTLNDIADKMDQELKEWKRYKEKSLPNLTGPAVEQMTNEIRGFEQEIQHFKFGIEILQNYPIILKSFIFMNRTFKNTAKNYDTWRLFQIVYIVSLIPDIAACDENVLTQNDKDKSSLNYVSLLYFPTGGGKTEAFLGVLVFNLFFDRLRGKNAGVTSILRYPLRLLSVQQVQRLANTLAHAEILRKTDSNMVEGEEFSLGYFVGKQNTPNEISKSNKDDYLMMNHEELDSERIIDVCPFCGKQTVHLKMDEKHHRLAHFCDNPECCSEELLPIYMVDNEIYRFLPSAIISTVDKMAILGNNVNFRNIVYGPSQRCPVHGFSSKGKCLVPTGIECENELESVVLYDPAPSLFIQDELHLIRESLGTYSSHYESFLDYYAKNVSPSHRAIKIIGATATISSYQKQIEQLYGKDPLRFPSASIYLDHDFYSKIMKDDLQRQILGFAAYGKAIQNTVAYSMKYMREVVEEYVNNPEQLLSIEEIQLNNIDEANTILKDYWIFLEYNNVKRDGNNLEGAMETPINIELRDSGNTPFIMRKMTGDESFKDVREVLAEVENSNDIFNGTNLIISTSMISHGVDADRFNIMFFYGMPGNTAEYIQAYSRTGRRFSSIVIDIIRPTRETDRSYLMNFKKFHEVKDILVEPVPINRWASKAIKCTISGIFAGLLYDKYDIESNGNYKQFFKMKSIKKAILDGFLTDGKVKEDLYNSYRCKIDGTDNEIGNQYKIKIDEFVADIFKNILDFDWPEENIFEGFKKMDYPIMNNMRDTDEQLTIQME